MTGNVVHPADLERVLQARVAAAKGKQTTEHRPHAVRVGRHRGRGPVALAVALVLTLGATAVLADGGTLDVQVADKTGYAVDTTDDGAIVEYIGDSNTTFGSAGTGTFGTFLQTQDDPSEEGYNTDGVSEFDTGASPQFNHAILLSEIPTVECESLDGSESATGLCWELFADINDSNANDPAAAQIQLTDLEIWLTADSEITGYDQGGTGFGSAADLVYDFDGTILINDVNQGSGRGDLRYLIPVDGFTLPADCDFGSSSCTTYFVVYTEWGDPGDGDYKSDSGFEEWKVKTYPFVSVTKTATTTFTRTFAWTIEKSVDPATWDLFDGDSGTSDWTVAVTKDDGTDSDWAVSGSITIANTSEEDALITSVSDVISGGLNATVDCGVTFPYELGEGDDLVCTYSRSLPDGTNRTNTATVTLEGGTSFDDDAAVTFGAPTTVVNGSIDVTDTNGMSWDDITDDDSFTYPETFDCGEDEGTHPNTATITQTGQSDDATVTVNCYQLTVTKDADTSFTRDHDWDIAKTRVILPEEIDGDGDPSTLTLADSQTYDINYEITVWTTGYTDSDWAVTGTITIVNPAPIDAVGVDVSDVVSVGINAVVDCDDVLAGNQTTVTIPANDSVDCSYSADLPDGTDRLNTATASLFGEDYTGDADVLFDGDSDVTELDTCIDVWDDNGTPGDDTDDTYLGEVCLDDLDAEDSFTFSHSIEVGPYECGEHTFTNVARFEASDTDETGSDDYIVAIDVPCPEGCTLTPGYWKTHNESFPGGAPADDTWLLILPSAEDSPFFLSGQTYYEVLWTAPKGNVYYNLSFHYIAAELNMLNGADGSSIQTEFDTATDLFETYTPTEIGALKGNNALRQQFISLAGTLGSYNEGLIGPGHCDDDGSGGETAAAGRVMAADLRRAFG